MTFHTGFFVIVEDEDCGDTHGDSAGLRNPSFLFFLSFFRSESKANQRKQNKNSGCMCVCIEYSFLISSFQNRVKLACMYFVVHYAMKQTFRSQRLYRHMETSPSWNIECGIGQMSNDERLRNIRQIHTHTHNSSSTLNK